MLDQGENNKSIVCPNTHDFCMVEFTDSQEPTNIGVPFTPGGAIIIYLPSYSVEENCFAYYILENAGTTLIGDKTSGCK